MTHIQSMTRIYLSRKWS